MIWKKFGIAPEEVHGCIKQKAEKAMGLYAKYRSNFKANAERIGIEGVDTGKEQYLLLSDIDDADFTAFLEGLVGYLAGLSEEISSGKKLADKSNE
jgi:hypothetical protein